MTLFDRFLRREAPPEQQCPRCGIPAPAEVNVCSACGWDLRESFSGQAGSYLGEGAGDKVA